MSQGSPSPDITVDGLTFEMQPLGGISQIFRECIPRICDAGARVTLCTASGTQQPIPEHPRLNQVEVRSFPALSRPEGRRIPVAAWWRRRILARPLRGRESSIWQSSYYTLPPQGWAGPRVVIVADLIYELFPHLLDSPGDALFRKQKRDCILSADTIICISETTKRDIQNIFDLGSTPVHVVHLAASDVYAMEPIPEREASATPFFLYVGGRSSYKNFVTVLEALTQLDPPARPQLLVAGAPFSKAEADDIAAKGLAETVKYADRPSERELAGLYSQATAFIYPSLYEGFGIPLVEALTRGCPIVASDIPSSREIAREAATYFDPSNPAELAAALRDIVENDDPSTPRQPHARARDFSWDKTARQVIDIYADL